MYPSDLPAEFRVEECVFGRKKSFAMQGYVVLQILKLSATKCLNKKSLQPINIHDAGFTQNLRETWSLKINR